MAQFDVHVLPDGSWAVNVQSDFVANYGTTFVIPLVLEDGDAVAVSRLNPSLRIDGEQRILATHLASAVYSRLLGRPRASLIAHEYAIKAAIDMLVSGY